MMTSKKLRDLASEARQEEDKYKAFMRISRQRNLPGDDVLNHASVMIELLPSRIERAARSGAFSLVIFDFDRRLTEKEIKNLEGVAKHLCEWVSKTGQFVTSHGIDGKISISWAEFKGW